MATTRKCSEVNTFSMASYLPTSRSRLDTMGVVREELATTKMPDLLKSLQVEGELIELEVGEDGELSAVDVAEAARAHRGQFLVDF